jgi:hypothetical protein
MRAEGLMGQLLEAILLKKFPHPFSGAFRFCVGLISQGCLGTEAF